MSTGANGTILMYTPSADGGMAQYAWELMSALARQQPRGAYRIEMVSGADLQEQFRSDEYEVSAVLPPLRHRSEYSNRLSWVAGRLMHYPRRERRFLKWLEGRPDVAAVHFQEWTPWLAGAVIRRIRASGRRVFHTVHNVVPHRYPACVPKAIVNGWIRRACRACDGLFVHTEALGERLSSVLGEGHPPIHVVPHGVWTVRDAARIPALDERLKWRRLLFFGSIRRNKGLDLLLAAMERLSGYSLTIAGEAHEREYFRSSVLPAVTRLRQAGVQVELLDRFTPEEEVPALFARHGAVMLPYTQGFVAQSGVIFMALAHEIPVVASEAGGMRELFAQFRVGETFAQETPAALAEAVSRLHAGGSGAGLIEQIRAAKRRFSWDQAARATLAGYDKVMDAVATQGRRQTDDRAVEATVAF